MMQHTKALSDLFENGDKLLVSFNTKNASLLEKLELLLLRFETSDPEQYTKVKSIRDKLVGEAHPYQGRFRKLRVEHEYLLSCLWDTQSVAGASTSAPVVLLHSRKKYSFLKRNMVHEDCTKREHTKFITDSRTWMNKTISEEERKEIGIVYAALRSVMDSGWTQALDRTPNIEKMSFEDIVKLMLALFLQKHPLVVQRIGSFRITE